MLNLPIGPDERRALVNTMLVEIVGGDDVVVMLDQRFNEGRSFREIAQLHGVTHPTVSSKINRACVRLRRVLHKHGHELPWDDAPALATRRPVSIG